jgi:arylsulfatase A-like enzyme
MRLFLHCRNLWTAFCLTAASLLIASPATQAAPPNIVFILTDDLGWSDLACYGADLHETPRLDAFAKEGMRFTMAYAASPVCTPSRASLLTGKAPARLHMTIWREGAVEGDNGKTKMIPAPAEHDLPFSEISLAKHLQEAGHLTALVGKWHLGDAGHYPEVHGFDVNIGGTFWGAPQTFFWPYRGVGFYGKEYRYIPHLEFGKEGEYLTDRLTDEAINVIRHRGNKPFFLYLAHHAPHTPIEAKAEDVKHFEAKVKPEMHHQNPTYAAMVKSIDENVGRVLDEIKAQGIENNTIVIFTSDNGGYIGKDEKSPKHIPVTSNWPLRSGKGSLYEGGVRVPLIIRWPGVAKEGSECRQPVVLTDWFFTLLKAAQVPQQGDAHDGVDITPLLKDPSAKMTRDTWFFHYPHYYATTTPVSSVREGDWKLLHYYQDDRVELFHLKDDPYEQSEISSQEPERAEKLRKKLDDWLKSVNAALPTKRPASNNPSK